MVGVRFADKPNPNSFYPGRGITATPEQVSDMDANTARFLAKRVAEFA